MVILGKPSTPLLLEAMTKYFEACAVEPLNTETLWDEQKCPSHRGVRLIGVIFNRNIPLGHR